MRELPLKKFWEKSGAEFSRCADVKRIESFGDVQGEYNALRTSAALCDFSFARLIEFSESDGIDFLDTILAANILKLRYGRIIDTFLASPDGKISAEAFVANIDDKVFLMLESLADSSEPFIRGSAKDLTGKFAILSVDGPRAWEIAKTMFGADIFNLPYLAIEKYNYDSSSVYLMRNGKTGEFGYTFIVPVEKAEAFAEKLLEATKAVGGRACGTKAHSIARLESGFFNIFAEGKFVGSPIELCLQWMTDFAKESFTGSEKIFSERQSGAKRKITAVRGAGVKLGAEVFDADKKIGNVIHVEVSPALNDNIGLALLKAESAYPSLELADKAGQNANIFTISRPMTISESLIKGMQQ